MIASIITALTYGAVAATTTERESGREKNSPKPNFSYGSSFSFLSKLSKFGAANTGRIRVESLRNFRSVVAQDSVHYAIDRTGNRKVAAQLLPHYSSDAFRSISIQCARRCTAKKKKTPRFRASNIRFGWEAGGAGKRIDENGGHATGVSAVKI